MRNHLLGWLSVVPVILLLSACQATGHHNSPWSWGGGVRVAPGWALGTEDGPSVHPMASYTYLSFSGGHSDVFELGGQLRQRIGTGGQGLWVGAEGGYARIRSSFDGSSGSASSNGWAAGGLAGIPVGQSRWGVNVYGAGGIMNFGSTGYSVRAGFDLQPWFLRQ